MNMQLRDVTYLPFYKRISNFYIPAVFVITAVLLEVVMFASMGVAFPSSYIFTLNIVLIIATIVALLRLKWLQVVVLSLLIALQLTVTISNIIATQTCGEIFSLETFNTISTAFDNANSVELNLWFIVPIIAIVVLYVVGVVLIMWFCPLPRNYRQGSRRAFLCGVLAFFSFFSYTVSYSCLPKYDNQSYFANLGNQKFLYDTFSNRVSNLYLFGSYSYYLDNALYIMGGKIDTCDVIKQEVQDFTPNEFMLPTDEVLGEGYNLVMILMETFERAAINPITMPNLYKFMQESCVEVNGYYSIERTCNSDYISQTGMNTWGCEWWSNYGDMPVQHSLANIFNRSGYTTMALHDSHGKAYLRNELFKPTLGFQSFNNNTTYGTEATRFDRSHAMNSDELMFKENLTKIAPSDTNFYSYLISASTHSISASWYDVHDYYPELAAYLEEPSNWAELTKLYPVLSSDDDQAVLTAFNYLVGTYSFDLGFGVLIDYMKTHRDVSGKYLIETTAIVMFGDHYYYVTPTVIKPENEDPSSLVGNRCPLIVYNPRAKVQDENGDMITQAENSIKTNPSHCGITLNRFTSTMDIYPTVCSLFGIQTDQQLTYGHSIFDSSSSSIGVGYLNGLTWGAVGYDEETDTWQIWRTLDFVKFDGITPNAEQMKTIEPLVNRTYASIFFNASMYKSNGFKSLKKYEAENAYKVGVIS